MSVRTFLFPPAIPVIARRLLIAVALVAMLGAASNALAGESAGNASEGVVNINTASEAQLSYLPGIGPSKASKILAYRAKRPFKRITHLARVRGIGLKTVRKLKPWLTISGDTTLKGPVKVRRAAPQKK